MSLAARPLVQSTYELLRQAAAEHGEREALAQKSIAATVTAGADERHGTLARVCLADPVRADEARQLLGGFAVACEVS